MTFLAPIPLPLPAPTLDDWSTFAKQHISTFFAKFCRDKPFDGVCLMLMPLPDALPLVAIEDEYDDEAALIEQVRAATDSMPTKMLPPNNEGHIVVAWPYVCADHEHRSRVLSLLREIAEGTRAVASAIVNECWLRYDVNGPSGTGEDSLILLSERVGQETTSAVAKIEGSETARVLAPWQDMKGSVRGPFTQILPRRDADADADATPPGFTPKINVSTVGEA